MKDGDPRMRKETKECMLSLLRSRSLILRILASVAESNTTLLFTKLSQDMRTLVRESIPSVLQNFWTEDGKDKVNSVIIPVDAVMRLREIYDSEQLIAIACLAESLSLSSYPDENCIEILRKSPSIQLPPIPEQEKPISFNKFFLRASTCGETLAILGSICIAVISQLKPQNSQKKNKKKHNKENVEISPDISQVRLVVFCSTLSLFQGG